MKHSRLNRIFVIAAVALAAAAFSPIAVMATRQPKWETVSLTVADQADPDKIDVVVRDGFIYLSAAKPLSVKIFTILGQPVIQASLKAGTSRLKLSARGIYILKAGSATFRVTI